MEVGAGVGQEGARGATLGWKARLTVEVVQKGLLEQRAHEHVHLIRLQVRNQDGERPQAHPSKGPEEMHRWTTHEHADRHTGSRGTGGGKRAGRPCPGFKQSPDTPRAG